MNHRNSAPPSTVSALARARHMRSGCHWTLYTGYRTLAAGFDHPVRRPLNRLQLRGQAADPLVVGAVHREGFAVEQGREGAGLRPGIVDPVPLPGRHVELCRRQVLLQGAAEEHVQHLMSPTDAQDRFSCPEICLNEAKLQMIPPGIQPEAGPVLLPVQGGFHILASGEDQTGAALRFRFGKIGGQRDASVRLYRLGIIPHQAGAQGDLDLRPHPRLRPHLPKRALPAPPAPSLPGGG